MSDSFSQAATRHLHDATYLLKLFDRELQITRG